MDWKRICDQIPEVVKSVKMEYILKNAIIKDDIFRILEKHCQIYEMQFTDTYNEMRSYLRSTGGRKQTY